MRSTMMLAVLLLPLALASDRNCTCPSSPTPEDSAVCGSDGRTYSSECELQCAGLPGLSAAHPGPCNTTVVVASRRNTVEYPEWNKCLDERQCNPPHWGKCKECGEDDEKCRVMCNWNCGCHCMGLPTGAGLDEDSYDRWEECWQERDCTGSKMYECDKNCDNQVCRNLCHMERVRCSCGCVQHVADTRTSTTAAPTSTTTAPTSTTAAPTTGTTTAPTSTTTAPTSTTAAPTSTTAAPTSTTAATTLRSTPSTTEAVTSTTQAVTSATDTDWTWQKYTVCVDQSCNCGRSSAPELQGIRKANCTCSCMGLPGGDLEAYDSEAVQRCLGDCGDQEIKCDLACRGQKDQKKQKECLDSCSLRKHQCRCECNSTKEH